MKKIKLFSAIGLLAFLSIAADFNNQKSDILGNNPVQIFKLQELSTPRGLPQLRNAKSITQKLESKKIKQQVFLTLSDSIQRKEVRSNLTL
jgi:Skp family chaperone for outer membrane proteins